MSVDNAPAIGLLTFCVNQAEFVTPAERNLLREMLLAAQTTGLREWGNMNRHRADEVWALFGKIKNAVQG